MRLKTTAAGVPIAIAFFLVGNTSYTTFSLRTDEPEIYTAMHVQDMEAPYSDGEAPQPEEDETIPVSRRLQLALAQVCVHESGFQVRTLDCRMMYEVLSDRSRTGRLT